MNASNLRTSLLSFLLLAGAVACSSNGTATQSQAGEVNGSTTEAGHAVVSSPLTAGLYQSAYSAKHDVIWATAGVGRPPVKVSSLMKLDAKTLAVKATYTPPVTNPATGAVEAVYGVAVDDEHDTVWVTNTRDNSVAVYNQADGTHLKSLPNVEHSREVIIDAAHDTAWITAFTAGEVVGFDTTTYAEKARIHVEGSGPTGLALDAATGTIYASDLAKSQLIVIKPGATEATLVPTSPASGPISVALSNDGKTAYTADQAAGALSVISLEKGTVTKQIPTGAGALSVAVDHQTGKILVANRTAATVTIVDASKLEVIEQLKTSANPNHVEIVNGVAVVLDKSGGGTAPDTIYGITL